MRQLLRRRKGALLDEGGFSILEVTATIGILAIMIVSITAALGNGFKYLLTSKQRAAAVQVANAQLERARAVASRDWTQLGLVSSDLASDSNIASGTCGSSTTNMFSGEPVMTSGTASSNPLYPHVQTIGVGNTQVTVKTYVTGVTAGGCSSTNPTYKRVTVVATWGKGQQGVQSSIKVATFVYGGVVNGGSFTRPPDPDLTGQAGYAASTLAGTSVILAGAPVTTAVAAPGSSSDGHAVGRSVVYKGSAFSAVGQVAGVPTTPLHTAATTVDNDDLTTGILPGVPTPVCDPASGSYTWTDFLGGLANANLTSTGSSCSTIAAAEDNLPNTTNASSLTSGINLTSTVPAAGVLPSFVTTLVGSSAAYSNSSSVDRVLSGSNQQISATASVVVPAIDLARFNIPGVYNANLGAAEISGGTFTATANAGPGAAAPSLSGVFGFKIYDPNNTLGCGTRSGSYCIYTVDPTAGGFTGFGQTYTVVLNIPSILPTARITLVTQVTVLTSQKSSTSSGGAVTLSSASYSLPKVTTTMTVQAPLSTTIAVLTSTADLGQLVATATYTA